MGVLEIREISKSFGGLKALSEVAFNVRKNEILSVIGPNGAGKTTLFNIISGFYRPDEGEVYLNGIPIHGLRPDEICKMGLTRTFQIVQPFPDLTVLDNVVIGALAHNSRLSRARRKAIEILKLVQLEDRSLVPAKNLTLADKKRLEVAKALATDPQILLMDESMAGLTPSEALRALELIQNLRKSGLTFVLIEHVMEIVMNYSDRIVVLNYGKKIAEGSPRETASNPDVIEAYLGKEDDA
jgi:branched-chain amino acid transport system ATP-binding protein